MLAAWYHLNLFPGATLLVPWSLCAFGSAAYLLTLAGFVFFGNHERPVDGSTRTATALAVGAAIIFVIYAWSEWPKGADLPDNPASNPSNRSHLSSASQTTSSCPNQTTSSCASAVSIPLNGTKSDGEDSLNLVNIFAAILGVVLAAVALIAQKSAVDAKAEAERAREDILEALDIRIVALSSRLLERAQTAKVEAEDFLDEAYEIADQDQEMTRFLHLGIEGLKRLAKFLMLLHRWLLEPRLTSTTDLEEKAAMLKLALKILDEKTTQAATSLIRDQTQRLRTEYWQPAGRLIESLLILGLPRSAISTEAEKVMLKLREVRAMLNRL
jgi:hypothetical protein